MNVRYFFTKMPTFFLALVVCLGSTSYSVRPYLVNSLTETETVEPQEEKIVCQRANESRLIRQNLLRKLKYPFSTGDGSSRSLKSFNYGALINYQRDYQSPILRAPPSSASQQLISKLKN